MLAKKIESHIHKSAHYAHMLGSWRKNHQLADGRVVSLSRPLPDIPFPFVLVVLDEVK